MLIFYTAVSCSIGLLLALLLGLLFPSIGFCSFLVPLSTSIFFGFGIRRKRKQGGDKLTFWEKYHCSYGKGSDKDIKKILIERAIINDGLRIKFLTTFKVENEENKQAIQEEYLLTLHEYKPHIINNS